MHDHRFRLAQRLCFLTLICMALTGCSSSHLDPIAWEADTFTLYSIDGNPSPAREPVPDDGSEKFHGYPVLGKMTIRDIADRKAILRALDGGIDANDGMVAGCFIPRHGIRTVKDNDTVEYVICFQCMQINIFKNGVQSYVLTTSKPQPVLDAMLTKANIPLAK